jgi:hypothetical protein
MPGGGIVEVGHAQGDVIEADDSTVRGLVLRQRIDRQSDHDAGNEERKTAHFILPCLAARLRRCRELTEATTWSV